VSESKRIRFLFVDDEPPVLNLLQTLFRQAHPDWESAFTDRGAKALLLMERQPFDVIVSDMRMPEMSGAELLEEVRDRYPRTARVILSGYADPHLSARSLGAAHQYLAKPFTFASLQSALNHILDARRFLDNPIIQQAIGGLHALPTAPGVHERFAHEIAALAVNGEALSSLVAQDIALTAKLLQVVHSSYFGPPRPLILAKECAHALGLNLLRSLTTADQLARAPTTPEVGGLNLDDLSRHGVAVGLRATRIMSLERAKPDAVKLAFTAGVLCGIGRLVLATLFPGRYAEALQRVIAGEVPLHQAEAESCGADHAQAGAYLLGLWGLPKELLEIVAYAHQPSTAQPSSFSPLTAVHVACHLESPLLMLPESALPPLDHGHLGALGLDTAHLKSWANATRPSL
jgi:HD-like signal output (HDOD) protein/CheY-like chemotaxis protein